MKGKRNIGDLGEVSILPIIKVSCIRISKNVHLKKNTYSEKKCLMKNLPFILRRVNTYSVKRKKKKW